MYSLLLPEFFPGKTKIVKSHLHYSKNMLKNKSVIREESMVLFVVKSEFLQKYNNYYTSPIAEHKG